MIEDLAAVMPTLGLAAERLHVERFTPGEGGRRRVRPPDVAAAPVAVATVTSEGVTGTFPIAAGETVIDAAVRAGRSLPYSCRGGMCCTCRARLVEGQVAMDANYSLEPWELAAGFVLTCQSRPLTELVVIDYDQV
jgi:ring-1,2-phenylacetyl-CoA epoxidase subunit PaaE